MRHSLIGLTLALILSACGANPGPTSSGSSSSSSSSSTSSSSSSSTSSSSSSSSGNMPVTCTGSAPTGSQNFSEAIRINQLGFLPTSNKAAVVVSPSGDQFSIVRASDHQAIFCGSYAQAKTWAPSNENVRIANFSEVTTPGEYYLLDSGVRKSYTFRIADDVYQDAHKAAIKAYYYNRASAELEAQHAGPWARPMGHPDTNVLVHSSAASASRPEGTVLSAPKGWYDAGDYNKYIVNSGISVHTLLTAYEQLPNFYQNVGTNIPESSNAVPDILDEVMWNLEWMAKMQDADGGVYHKLTTKNFSGEVMPHETTAQRYVVQKTTAATLNFAATLAMASRIYSQFDAAFPGKAQAYRQQALAAWQWAKANPQVLYTQPTDIKTGTYAENQLADEFAWAAAELFLLTEDAGYFNAFKTNLGDVITPWWGGVQTLGVISLLEQGENLLSSDDYNWVQSQFLVTADALLTQAQASAYGVTMNQSKEFGWGSNSSMLNQGWLLMIAYRATQNVAYRNASLATLDYVLGRNATGYSFVTGQGKKPPTHPHHRPSEADEVTDPVPGFLVGGPHSGQQDSEYCDVYPSNLAAKSYLDQWCSYATNEVTINWNAPLVYLLGAAQNF